MNICYLILNILFLITFICYIRKNHIELSLLYKMLFFGIYFIFTLFTFSYFNHTLDQIFALKYLNVKAYLILLFIVHGIILYIMRHPIRLEYKILSYILFGINMIVLGATLSVVLGNKFNEFYIMDIKNAINFIDLSFVIFFCYIIICSLIYIGEYIIIYDSYEIKHFQFDKLKINNIKKNILSVTSKWKKNTVAKQENILYQDTILLTPEELLNYHYQDGFYIHGYDASIIFNDSNKENIIRNYYILNEDIHAKLVNGYTLDENKMFKNICFKLNVSNLCTIDLHNVSVLNKISIDEYNLLKKVNGMGE